MSHMEGKLIGANLHLAKLKSIANSQVKKQLYISILQSHQVFGLLIWVSTYPTDLNQLETIKDFT